MDSQSQSDVGGFIIISVDDATHGHYSIGMSNIEDARRALSQRVLDGEGFSSRGDRQKAFNNRGLDGAVATLVDRVARGSSAVRDENISAAMAAGLSEDQIFEIAACAAIGQASRQYDIARLALKIAIGSDHETSSSR